MSVAVLADVHANLHALDAVLEDLARIDPDRIVVLGDLVGYGARPREVIARIREVADLVVLGNHDHGVAQRSMAAGTRASAQRAVDWTRERLDADELAYLAELPRIGLDASGVLCAHGCYLNPDHYYGYVTSTMLEANLDAIAGRDEGASVALCGHTHVPMVAHRARAAVVEAWPGEGVVRWPTDAEVVLINPGAVGQPRDGDLRAAWALIDPEAGRAEIRRVAYDVEAAVCAILDGGLPPENAERLREGR
ncbi:MAG: metallophosphoesterase family protein [Myxococcales bacterium]|nr:metallophosphoesterase family protein [Myxococcales bacterium]